MQALMETWHALDECEKVRDLAAVDRHRQRARAHLAQAMDEAHGADPALPHRTFEAGSARRVGDDRRRINSSVVATAR